MRITLTLLALIFLICTVQEGCAQEKEASVRDVVIVVDNSGSMRTSDPEYLTGKVCRLLLEGLPEDSRISFVIFAETSELAMPLSPVADERTREKVTNILSKVETPGFTAAGPYFTVTIQKGDTLWDLAREYYGDPLQWPLIMELNNIPNGGKVREIPIGMVIRIPVKDAKGYIKKITEKEHTNIPAAVERAIYELRQNSRENADKLIVLLTDGIINMGDSAREVERYRWLKNELAMGSKAAGVRVFSIVFADQADFEIIQTLAQKTGGDYYRVAETQDIHIALSGVNEAITQPQSLVKEIVLTEKGKMIPAELLLLAVMGIVVLGVIAVVYNRRKKGEIDQHEETPNASLIDVDGVTGKKIHKINQRVTMIGREKTDHTDISIGENTVSAAHAQVRYKDGGFYLTDLGSRNGTYLNEGSERITGEVRLKGGDIIAFDQYKFKFVVHGQSERGETQLRAGKQDRAQLRPSPSSPHTATVMSMRSDKESEPDEEIGIPEAYLIDVGGVTGEKIHKIHKRIITIGRMEGNGTDIPIGRNTVSTTHAQIEYRDNDFYLSDLGSRNGTYLNERRERITSEVRLNGDDIIYFDQYRFRFVLRGQGEWGGTRLTGKREEE